MKHSNTHTANELRRQYERTLAAYSPANAAPFSSFLRRNDAAGKSINHLKRMAGELGLLKEANVLAMHGTEFDSTFGSNGISWNHQMN